MRDWNAYADHLRSLREQDPAGVFVGADVVLELIEDRMEMLRAMIRLGTCGNICEYCAKYRYAENCVEYECDCEHCHYTCECRSCTNGSGFVWAGSKPEPAPEITVEDEAPSDPASARWTVAMLADGTVMPLEISERPGLEQLQTMVGGHIETLEFRIPGRGVRFVGVFDEEGKLKDLPVNELATQEFMVDRSCLSGDYLAGTVLLLKIEGEDIVGMTAEETAMLMRCFDKEWEAQV